MTCWRLRPPRKLLLVTAAGAGLRTTKTGGTGSAQRGGTVCIAVRIAIVWTQHNRFNRRRSLVGVMGPDAGFMATFVCQGQRARERDRTCQCYCGEPHVFLLGACFGSDMRKTANADPSREAISKGTVPLMSSTFSLHIVGTAGIIPRSIFDELAWL